ncbi:MAG: tail protein X, partial [Proteobacteria bacterium]|nr:tail protein X [Pseudomonadota bacterium]
MSTTYNVVAGDTFELIARKKYGTEQDANRIATANPGVSEPLTPGTVITIPTIPDAPKNIQQQTDFGNIDETAVLINGTRFKFWDKIRIIDSLDTIGTVEFSAPFDVDLPNFKEAFRPFSFQSVVITVGGDPVFTGTMLTPNPVIENNSKTISVSCYSLPGALNDCTPPASSFPLEFNGQGLQEIITTLVSPFGISVEFQAEQGAVFDRVAIEPGQKILAFIISLLKQRNLVLTSDAKGKLIIL